MTLSIVGWCPRSGRVGMAITSSSPAVAARCANVRAGVGAASTQNITDPRLGPRLLDLLEAGHSPEAALEQVAAEHELIDYRQLSVVDMQRSVGRVFRQAHPWGPCNRDWRRRGGGRKLAFSSKCDGRDGCRIRRLD